MGVTVTAKKTARKQRRSPKQSRARYTCQLILEATTRIIGEQGPNAVTTNRIAERAGVSIGTLYGYFPDKQAILVALARQILLEDRAAIAAAIAEPGRDLISALIQALFARHLKDKLVRQTVMSAHLAEGLGVEHAQNIDWFLEQMAKNADFEGVPPASRKVAIHAALGIARALTDDGYGAEALPLASLESLTRDLVEFALQSGNSP